MKNIRILFFIHSLTGGGAERQLGYLVKNSDKSLFSYAICCIDTKGINQFSDYAQIISSPGQWYPFLSNWHNTNLYDWWKPDIVHTWIPLVLPESLSSGKKVGQHRFLANYRNVYTLNHIRRLHQFVCLFQVGKIISNVEPTNLKQPFRYLYDRKSGAFISNGFDIDTIIRADPMNLNDRDLSTIRRKVLYVGRLANHKNIKTLLEATSLLNSTQDIHTHLILCGKGKQETELKRKIVELDLQDDVALMGYLDNVYQVMKSCDCLVLPSFTEGMPNVVFEAMLAKIPVIASDIPVHRRWTQNGNLATMFDPHSPESLKDALLRVLCEPENERQVRTEAAYQYAAQFSIASMVEKYEQLYQTIVNGG